MTTTPAVRFGVIGLGNIGRVHVDNLLQGRVPEAEIAAVVGRATEYPSIPHVSVEALICSPEVDVVLVATPTMDHVATGLQVLEAGKHLVMEKPLGLSLLQARSLVAAVPEERCAAVMLNQRYHPAYAAIKEIIDSGRLGTVSRFSWIMTAWYRPDVYFLVSRWRGTWRGEGGGVLINQCIHNLDILQWLFGMPRSLISDVRLGKYHGIEVEDEVTAIFSYGDQLTGTLIASTGEAPGRNLLDVVGDRGTLSYDGERLLVSTTQNSLAEYTATTKEMFGQPQFAEQSIDTDQTVDQHVEVLSDVVNAIKNSRTPASPLAAGLNSIELANAILLSGWQDQRVYFPLDAQGYEHELAQRVDTSTLRTPKNIDVQIDMDRSYR